MTLPTFDATKHDVSINGVGYMRHNGGDATIQRQDFAPATSRAAVGEGRYDSFQTESFVAQAEFSSGAGQRRLVDSSAYLSGIGDGRWGAFFPAKKRLTESDGGTSTWYFARGSTLYGMTATPQIETIGTATTQAMSSGTVECRPAVSGSNAAFWVQNNAGTRTLYKWTGSGSPTDVTPEGVTPYVVERFGKWMWLLGKRQRESDITLVQSNTNQVAGVDTISTSWDQPTVPGNSLIAALWYYSPGDTLARASGVTDTTGWTYIGQVRDITNLGAIQYYIIPAADRRVGNETMSLDGDADQMALTLMEFEGMALDSVYDLHQTAKGTPSSGATTVLALSGASTGTLTQAKSLIIHAFAYADTEGIDSFNNEVGYTPVYESPEDQDWIHTVSYKVVSATTSEQETFSGTRLSASNVTTAYQSIIMALKGTSATADYDQFTIHYTSDDGVSWTEVSPTASTGIGQPIAAYPAYGYLWFTTATGLYQMAAEERTFADQTSDVLVGIREVDRWGYTGVAGTRLTAWDGLVYWNVGATIRRYAPGGSASQVFPNERWSTVTGNIQGMTSGEGGVYFGCGGYLWVYNARGFHALAKESTSGDFDTLHWHNGRLYCKGDPANYYQFTYPSSRPDQAHTDSSTVDTGYVILSQIDFEKVSEYKVIRSFQTHGYFTAVSDSGTIDLDYLVADDGAIDPGRAGGGDTGNVAWVRVGSMTIADGGSKSFTLSTPLTCRRLYLRATLTPGASGYPVLQSVVAYGRSVMPSSERIVMPLQMFTGQRDKTNAVIYATDADVKEAVDALRALRKATNVTYFDVGFINEIGGVETYTVTAEAMSGWLTQEKQQRGIGFIAQFSVTELPR